MKTSKVLQTIDVMTESVVKELNDMSEKIEKLQSEKDNQYDFLLNMTKELKTDSKNKTLNWLRLDKYIKELCDNIDGKANKPEVQTIAKHLINLETRVADLEKDKSEKTLGKFVKDNCLNLANITAKVYQNQYGDWCVFADLVNELKAEPQPDHTVLTDYFLKAKNLLIEYAEKTMIKKGLEYTPIGDRFANFRPILGEKKTAIEKLIGYNAKHVQYCFMQESNMTAKTVGELLEHWGDVFNYNVLGLAMENTDRSKAFVVPYADRPTQEKEIKNIVNSVKNIISSRTKLSDADLYTRLLSTIHNLNLSTIIYLFAKQLERLENSK